MCSWRLIKKNPMSFLAKWHSYLVIVKSVKIQKSLRFRKSRNAIFVPFLILLADSPSFVVNNFTRAHSVGERSEIGMPSVQEVHDQPGDSLQPEVAIFKRWLTWSQWRKKFANIREIGAEMRKCIMRMIFSGSRSSPVYYKCNRKRQSV